MDEEKPGILAELSSAEYSFANILYNYNQLIDGGNTNSLLQEIQSSWEPEAWELRDSLLVHSPYLSENVLREAALSGILPHAMLLEICMANPDATKGRGFIDFLRYEIPYPLPEYMIEIIESSWNDITPRTVLEASLAYWSNESSFLTDVLLADLVLDSITDHSEYVQFLNKRRSLSDEYSLVEDYVNRDLVDSAFFFYYDLINNYELSDFLQSEYSEYWSLLNLWNNLFSGGRTYSNLNPGEISNLELVAISERGRPSAMAQNILCYFYQNCIELPSVQDPQFRKQGNITSVKTQNENKFVCSINPNPAKEKINIKWSVETSEPVFLTITDYSGRQMLHKPLQDKAGKIEINLSEYNNGIYLFEIHNFSVKFHSEKIIINNH